MSRLKDRILLFWFGDVWKTGKFDAAKLEMWFKKDLELDKKIREEYGEEIRNISNDENRLADLQSDPDEYTRDFQPLEHQENLDLQIECVSRFENLAQSVDKLSPWKQFIDNATKYAREHLEVIERFGRFPHRNAILNRESTKEELEYLEKHGGF